MLFIGPMDISQSLGHPGDPAHPEVQQVVRQVIDTCNANKKPFGIFVGTTEAARKYRDLGASYIAIASDLAFMAQGLSPDGGRAEEISYKKGGAAVQRPPFM